jgi:hypothetical protein
MEKITGKNGETKRKNRNKNGISSGALAKLALSLQGTAADDTDRCRVSKTTAARSICIAAKKFHEIRTINRDFALRMRCSYDLELPL